MNAVHTADPNDRFVVGGLSRPRLPWFRDVAQWANNAALPIEFVKFLGTDQLEPEIEGVRKFSAVLLDGGMSGIDRDTLSVLSARSVAAIVVDDIVRHSDWLRLGAVAVLPTTFDRVALHSVLSSTTRPVVSVSPTTTAFDHHLVVPESDPIGASLVAILGAGGTGTSTIAMAAAQYLGGLQQYRGHVLLADLHLNPSQALLHDARVVSPGIQDLVDQFRSPGSAPTDIRTLTFPVHTRGYDLLLGLRRQRHWSTIRSNAFRAALFAVQRSYSVVIADVSGDLEGEVECGSVDVEERNLFARTLVAESNVVVAVGQASLKGMHSLFGVLQSIREQNVPEERVLPILNFAPATARERAAFTKAFVELTGHPIPPVFIPVKNVDACLCSGSVLPSAITGPIGQLLRKQLDPKSPSVKTEPNERSLAARPKIRFGSRFRFPSKDVQ